MASRPWQVATATALVVAGMVSLWALSSTTRSDPPSSTATTTTATAATEPAGPAAGHGGQDAPAARGAQAVGAAGPVVPPAPPPPPVARPGPVRTPVRPVGVDDTDAVDADAGNADVDTAVPRFAGNADGIREAMAYAKHDLRECYDAWAKLQPDLAGTLKVSFVVTPQKDGAATVEDVVLADSSLQHTWVEGCVAGVVRDLSFDPPADGGPLRVTYPIAFAAKHE